MTLWSLAGIILLIAANAFFVAAEFGLVSARRTEIEVRAQTGSRLAKTTLRGMERVSLMLAAAQLGVTLCSLALGAIGEPFIAYFLESPFHALHVPTGLLHPLSIFIALLAMTYLHVVFGEMIPKNIALARAERVSLLLTPPLLSIVKLLYPAVIFLNGFANIGLRLLGVKPQNEISSAFTLDEVAGFVEESHREGLLSRDEQRLVKGSLEFDEKTVMPLLLSLEQLVTITVAMTPAEIEALVTRTGFSRFPVRNKQQLTGYIHLKDILDVDPKEYHQPLDRREVRPLPVIKPADSLQDALRTMQHAGAHMAQVVNNRGRLLGVVMLEDTLEELVGEIRDSSRRSVS
ncbi:MAG: hypothetical protein JWM81_778 [Candidatus Saccharibacteria bacterium]|nr:hypothetical protein [Candidatus Saccharibacteria bacterium]